MITIKSYTPGLRLESCINEVLRQICHFGGKSEEVRLSLVRRNDAAKATGNPYVPISEPS